MPTISIIGTAGRKEDGPKLSKEVYTKMYQACLFIVEPLIRADLISGGAAWADHLAVSLFLAGKATTLRLHLPCEFDFNSHKFAEDGFRSPGSVANYYHRLFSQKMGGNTLLGIEKALLTGATYTVSNGFFARNKKVAQSDTILAFTFGEGDVPKDGGTSHTWNQAATNKKIHFPIQSL